MPTHLPARLCKHGFGECLLTAQIVLDRVPARLLPHAEEVDVVVLDDEPRAVAVGVPLVEKQGTGPAIGPIDAQVGPADGPLRNPHLAGDYSGIHREFLGVDPGVADQAAGDFRRGWGDWLRLDRLFPAPPPAVCRRLSRRRREGRPRGPFERNRRLPWTRRLARYRGAARRRRQGRRYRETCPVGLRWDLCPVRRRLACQSFPGPAPGPRSSAHARADRRAAAAASSQTAATIADRTTANRRTGATATHDSAATNRRTAATPATESTAATATATTATTATADQVA